MPTETDDTDSGVIPAESMTAKLNRKVESIMLQVDQWRELLWEDERMYQELLRHFNGGALVVDTSGDEEKDYASNLNIARARLLKIAKERNQPYYSKLGIFDVKLVKEELSSRQGLELAANETLSKIFRSDMRMTPHYKAVIEDAILTGRGVMWRRNPTQIIPEWGRILVHPDAIASQKDDSFADWAFESTIKASELFRISRQSAMRPALKAQAKRLLDAILERHNTANGKQPLNWPTNEPWETFDETLGTTRYGIQVLNTVIPVYWYFEKDMSGPPSKRPVSVYCVARHGVDLSIVSDGKNKSVSRAEAVDGLIYMREDAFKHSGECLWLFTIGAQFGGRPTMGRLKGEGEIQYFSDVRIQIMMNALIRRIEVENMTLLQEGDAVNSAKMKEFQNKPIKDGDVIPAGLKFVENRFSDKGVNQMMGIVSQLMGFAADHADIDTGHVDNPREEAFKDQVIERLQDRAAAKSIVESQWSDCLDMFAVVVGELLFNKPLAESDEAWEFRKMFMDAMKDAGFGDVTADQWKDATRVTARRNPGHGDPGVAMARADLRLQLAMMRGPEAMAKAVFEKAVLVEGGDVKKAIALFGLPGGGEPPKSQDAIDAERQMALILNSGAEINPEPNDDPMIHTGVQMTVLEASLAGYQKDQGWTREAMRTWDAGLAHAIKDVARIQDEKMRKDSLGRIAQIQRLAGSLPVFEQGQPQIDPVKQAELNLKMAEQERKVKKDEDANLKWEIAQRNREESGADQLAVRQHEVISGGARADREQASKEADRRIKAAVLLKQATTPEAETDTDE